MNSMIILDALGIAGVAASFDTAQVHHVTDVVNNLTPVAQAIMPNYTALIGAISAGIMAFAHIVNVWLTHRKK